jgi:hypothetical protein
MVILARLASSAQQLWASVDLANASEAKVLDHLVWCLNHFACPSHDVRVVPYGPSRWLHPATGREQRPLDIAPRGHDRAYQIGWNPALQTSATSAGSARCPWSPARSDLVRKCRARGTSASRRVTWIPRRGAVALTKPAVHHRSSWRFRSAAPFAIRLPCALPRLDSGRLQAGRLDARVRPCRQLTGYSEA